MRTFRYRFLAALLALPLLINTSLVNHAEAHRRGFGWGLAAGIATAIIVSQAYRHAYYGGYPAYYSWGYPYPPYGRGHYTYSLYPRRHSYYSAPYYGRNHYGF